MKKYVSSQHTHESGVSDTRPIHSDYLQLFFQSPCIHSTQLEIQSATVHIANCTKLVYWHELCAKPKIIPHCNLLSCQLENIETTSEEKGCQLILCKEGICASDKFVKSIQNIEQLILYNLQKNKMYIYIFYHSIW